MGSPAVLLLLPAVCVILGWTHTSNDRKVWEIGRHIRRRLVPLASRATDPSPTPFGWESAHRLGRGYRVHRWMQRSVTLLTYCGPGVAAIFANRREAAASALILGIVTVEAAALLALGYLVLVNTDRHGDSSSPDPE